MVVVKGSIPNKVTSLILVLLIQLILWFDTSFMSSTSSEWGPKKLQNNQTKIRSPTGVTISPYLTNISGIPTNFLVCLNSWEECGTDPMVRISRAVHNRSRENINRICSLSPILHKAWSEMFWESRKWIEGLKWTLSNPSKPNGPHKLFRFNKGRRSSFSRLFSQLESCFDFGFVLDITS